MYGAKFTLFYLIAALAALASATPIPAAAPEARRVANIDVIVREPVPVADAVVAREPAPVVEEDEAKRNCGYFGGCL